MVFNGFLVFHSQNLGKNRPAFVIFFEHTLQIKPFDRLWRGLNQAVWWYAHFKPSKCFPARNLLNRNLVFVHRWPIDDFSLKILKQRFKTNWIESFRCSNKCQLSIDEWSTRLTIIRPSLESKSALQTNKKTSSNETNLSNRIEIFESNSNWKRIRDYHKLIRWSANLMARSATTK